MHSCCYQRLSYTCTCPVDRGPTKMPITPQNTIFTEPSYPLWLLPKVVVPFSIGALDAQNQCSLPASSTAAAPATPFFYSEPLKMRSAPPFPQCIISQPEFLLSRMNPEFKLVELSQKHILPSSSSLVPQLVGGKDLWSVFTALNWSPK